MAIPAPGADETATPVYAMRRPKNSRKAYKFYESVSRLADDLESALLSFGLPPVVTGTPVVALTDGARDTYWGVPATAAARRSLQDSGAITVRPDKGFAEQYFAGLTDGGANPGGRTAAGWYRVFPGSDDTGWIALPLLAGWVAYGGGTGSPRYRRKDGRVQVVGLIKNGTATAGTTLATLPAGFRPSSTEIYAVHNGTAARGVQVDTSGNIQCGVGITNPELGLASITFWVD